MRRILHLWKGEIYRLFKYNIIVFGIIVSLIWVLILALSDVNTAKMLAPALVLMDGGLMSIILLGSQYFLERQEGSMHAVMVSPAKLSEVLIAKVGSALVTGLISLVIVVGGVLIFHGNVIQIIPMIFYMILVILAHTALGFLLALYSRDFLQMLVRYMGIILLFMSPYLLFPLGVIPQSLDFLSYLSPSYAGQLLFSSTVSDVETWRIIFCAVYLAVIPALLYPFVVYKVFVKKALEG
ncbi:MAG: ABC transporter permease [Candidatus Izemoplasmatales bacterium]|nr:ABC transporter permease [Candidatus Izemoplasmatales bacterium]